MSKEKKTVSVKCHNIKGEWFEILDSLELKTHEIYDIIPEGGLAHFELTISEDLNITGRFLNNEEIRELKRLELEEFNKRFQ